MPITPIYYVCFLNNYNNYFNRIIKGYETLAEYQTAVGTGNYFLFSKPINYNPNDNVSTELIMNDCPFDADYLLILDSNLDIVARWFIMESVFTREKQKKYELRRDVIYDFKTKLLNSPVFVQKGMLSDEDPFIFNSEGMSFNEIKKSETLLKDRTNSAWIVGYVAKNAGAGNPTIEVDAGSFDFLTLSEIATDLNCSEADLASVLSFDPSDNIRAYFTYTLEFRFITYEALVYHNVQRITMNGDLTSGGYVSTSIFNYDYSLWHCNTLGSGYAIIDPKFRDALIANKASILAQVPTMFSRKYFTKTQYDKLMAYQGKIIVYNGIFYVLNIATTESAHTEETGFLNYTTYSSISNVVSAVNSDLSSGFSLKASGRINTLATSYGCTLNMTKLSDTSGVIPAVETKISSSRNKVLNQAFDMFAIPFGPAKFVDSNGETKTAISDYAISIAAKIAEELDASLYDIQLLPYCPVIDNFNSSNIIDLSDLSEDVDFNYITKSQATIRKFADQSDYSDWAFTIDGGEPPRIATFTVDVPIDNGDITGVGYVINRGEFLVYSPSISHASVSAGISRLTFSCRVNNTADVDAINVSVYYEYSGTDDQSFIIWAKSASFSTELKYSLTLKNSVKVESECNKYRLCSPNYQGSFDFNVARNGGAVAFFLAECTYKPYTPYIKVVPQFGGLYGSNFGDSRGLICGGDFSLPRFTSAWETFQLNNKNYQNIFNREIQNLSINQSIQRTEEYLTGALGVATAGIAGAGVGAKAGGVYGAIAGAAVGTAGSAIGLAVDIDLLSRKQREAKQFAIDKYNFQLGNIKALPYTITKVGSFDINSKVWPFLEYYTCTDEEKEALENKILYESMTVMRIETLGNYYNAFESPRYFKGELIRNEVIEEDNHLFEAIYTELLKGVYI